MTSARKLFLLFQDDELKKIQAVLEESCEILKDDVGAPEEIKKLSKNRIFIENI